MKTREQALQQAADILQGLNTETVQMMAGLMQAMAQDELYREDTPQEKLEEIRGAFKQKSEERRAAMGQKKIVPLYERNRTMQMMGKGRYYTLVSGCGRYRAEYDDILNAYLPENDFSGLCLDIYAFGIICGKREERRRRRRRRA